jgi:hypothetical protein
MASYPDINGARTSYASITFGVAERTILGIKALNYKDTGEIPKIRGTSGLPVGRTRGTADHEGDVEFYQEEWDELLPILTGGGVWGYMERSWPLRVCYSEISQPEKTVLDILVGVRFFGAEKSNSEGNDALTVKVNLSIMEILWNGRYAALRSVNQVLPGL